jgi:hypothetical protein
LNYFNYFTEIEDTFIRRRGKHLLLSPMDWALIESWKEKGVPLHVALRAIEHTFDSHEAKPRRRSVKSLLYCQEEVEAQFGEWLEGQVGGGPPGENGAGKLDDDGLPFSRTAISSYLERSRTELEGLRAVLAESRYQDLSETMTRVILRLQELEKDFVSSSAPNAEKLEESLASLERLLDHSLRSSTAPESYQTMLGETRKQLKPYQSRMDEATYQQTLDNLLLKRLRELYGVPRLSLFFL